jgi:DNA-binding response OmpR family regulator
MNTILLVDDHHAFRTVFSEILRQRGYMVLEAGARADVEHLTDQHPGPIDLAVIEAVLSTDNGAELAKRVAIHHPRAKILFISEQAPEALRMSGLLPVGSQFLGKPFGAEEFCSRVEELLAAPASR